MPTPFLVSYFALWFLVLATLTIVVAMYSHLGSRYLQSREGRTAQGPDVGTVPRSRILTTIQGDDVRTPTVGSPSVVLFTRVQCKPCERLRGYLWAGEEMDESVNTILVCEGAKAEVSQWAAGVDRTVSVIADVDGRITAFFGIASTPFGFGVDASGHVVAKGIMSEEAAFRWLLRRASGVPTALQPSSTEVEA
jgi:hypothetical protein